MSVDHYENFPVASWLCPPAMRPAVRAIYWFARTADDIADEPGRDDKERLRQLVAWGARLDEAVEGGTVLDDSADTLIFAALANTIRVCNLPVPLFHDLLPRRLKQCCVPLGLTGEIGLDISHGRSSCCLPA